MDQALIRFQHAARRENRHRPLRRRYSPTLQQQAVEYWQQRRGQEGLRTIAATLGVTPTTLQRWTRTLRQRPRFRPIDVLADRRVATGPVVIAMTADGPRVEGLTVETAARLLTLLR
jgi:transposase-like protein